MKWFLVTYAFLFFLLSVSPCTDAASCSIKDHAQLTEEQSHQHEYEHHHEHSHGDEEDSCSPFCLCNCCGAQYMQLPTYYSFKQRTPEIEKSVKPLFSFNYAFELHTSIWHPPIV